MSGPATTDLLDRTERNLVEIHWRTILEGPGPHRREWPGATAVGNDLPSPAANTLFIFSEATDLRQLFREARLFFRSTPSWRVSAPARLHEAIERVALTEGLRANPAVPRMSLSPIPTPPPVPDRLTIRSVTTRSELHDFCEVVGKAHGIPRWQFRLAFPRVPPRSESGEPQLRFFVGYVAGKPVATAGHTTSDGVIGIFSVGTLLEARRKGYGEALTWAAIQDGRRVGAEVAWLHSTAMGHALYERMGFRQVLEEYSWVAPAHGVGELRALFRLLRLVLFDPRRRVVGA